MMKSILRSATMMVETVAGLVLIQTFVQNVIVLTISLEMDSILYLEMAFAMITPIMLNVFMMVETAVLMSTKMFVLSATVIVKILNLLVMTSVIMKQILLNATMMVEIVVDQRYHVSDIMSTAKLFSLCHMTVSGKI